MAIDNEEATFPSTALLYDILRKVVQKYAQANYCSLSRSVPTFCSSSTFFVSYPSDLITMGNVNQRDDGRSQVRMIGGSLYFIQKKATFLCSMQFIMIQTCLPVIFIGM